MFELGDSPFIPPQELSPLTGAIKILPNRKYLSPYIIYLVQMADFTILDQVSKRIETTFITLNYPTTVGTEELFTSSPLHLRITKTRLSTHRAASHCNEVTPAD